jgi:tetratricopeptide (TPR) repeat protein
MHRILVIVISCAAIAVARAQTPEQLFADANQLYQQGKFPEARASYERILSSGYAAGELSYNLGNACYKEGDIPHAILNYERALRRISGDDDVRHNLQIANLMIIDKIEPTPRIFIWEYWDGVKSWFTMTGVTLVAYAWFVLFAASLAVVALARTYALRKIAFLTAAGTFVVCLFFTVVLFDKKSDLVRSDLAIVVSQIVTVKNSPDPMSSDAFVLHGGVKVQITDRFTTWMKIRLADGKVGWMDGGAAEVI